MIYLKRPNAIAVVLSAIVILASCKKDGDSHVPPVTEPLTVAAAKPGDTLTITGQNFSTVATENTVEINGVAATVVSATSTEIKVIIPANATSGAVIVTVFGNEAEAGPLVVSPLTIYAIKEDNTQLRQLVAISPENGNETVIIKLNDLPEQQMVSLRYQASTNEVIGIAGANYNKLLKVNVTTKKTTTLPLSSVSNVEFSELVAGKNGELYGCKRDYNTGYVQSLVKIDPKTGENTTIKSFGIKSDWTSLVYLPASNEVAGIANYGARMLKVNLTTKDTSGIYLTSFINEEYIKLAEANGELYTFRNNYANINNYQTDIMKLNPATGDRTVIGTLSKFGALDANMIYLPQRKEIVGVWEYNSLLRYGLTNNTSTYILFPAGQKAYYGSLTSN